MTDALFLADAAQVARASVGSLVALTGDEGRHAAVVRRIRVGESVLLADGAGRAVRGVVEQADKQGLQVRVAELLHSPERALRFTAVQALAKGDRSDLAVETLTELGVDEVLAWQASRSVVRWEAKADKGLAKWQATAREATKQSRRYRVPGVEYASSADVTHRIAGAALSLVLHEDATAWLHDIALPDAGEVLFVVGPEGGVSPDELQRFTDAGARAVLVSDAVLRSSTAGVVALAQLQAMASVASKARTGVVR